MDVRDDGLAGDFYRFAFELWVFIQPSVGD